MNLGVVAILLLIACEAQPEQPLSLLQECLRELGLEGIDVKKGLEPYDMGQLFSLMNEKYRQKDKLLREVNVLNYMREHMELLVLQLDPIYYPTSSHTSNGATLTEIQRTMRTISRKSIPVENIPGNLYIGKLQEDYKSAFVRWYRILANSNDYRIKEFITALPSTFVINAEEVEMVAAQYLATIWCIICNGIHTRLGSNRVDSGLVWNNADEVANAFAAFTAEGLYIEMVKVFFDKTLFSNRQLSKLQPDKGSH